MQHAAWCIHVSLVRILLIVYRRSSMKCLHRKAMQHVIVPLTLAAACVVHTEHDTSTHLRTVTCVLTRSSGAGRTRIRLKSTGEVFSLVPPNCKAHNLIVGRTWVDSAGDFTLLNATTGAKGSMYFTPCGWFGAGHHEVRRPPLLILAIPHQRLAKLFVKCLRQKCLIAVGLESLMTSLLGLQ